MTEKLKKADAEKLAGLFAELGYPGSENLTKVLGENADIVKAEFARKCPEEAYEAGAREGDKNLLNIARAELINYPARAYLIGRDYKDKPLMTEALEKLVGIRKLEDSKELVRRLYLSNSLGEK